MNILFALISYPECNQADNMYSDLVKEYQKHGHSVSVIAPSVNGKTHLGVENGVEVLRVNTIPFVWQKYRISKGISMLMMPGNFKRAYKKHLYDRQYDWVVMPTPSITLIGFAEAVKKRCNSKIYLILRDIHPQSSASLGEIKSKLAIKYLDSFAHKAYKISNIVGCMSPMNIDFVCSLYKDISNHNFRILYNWITAEAPEQESSDVGVREKYGLEKKFIALFGGNIGYGQRIENIQMLAQSFVDNDEIRFVIIGKGTRKNELELYCTEHNLTNVMFIDFMPRRDYMQFLRSVDVGLVSINEKNAAPTCPSKAVAYMASKIPVFAMINDSDYGTVYIENPGAGMWCVGGNATRIAEKFQQMYEQRLLFQQMGQAGYDFYLQNLTTQCAYDTMIKHMNEVVSE